MKKLPIMLFALLLASPLFSGQAFAADNGAEESSENGQPAPSGGDAEPECD